MIPYFSLARIKKKQERFVPPPVPIPVVFNLTEIPIVEQQSSEQLVEQDLDSKIEEYKDLIKTEVMKFVDANWPFRDIKKVLNLDVTEYYFFDEGEIDIEDETESAMKDLFDHVYIFCLVPPTAPDTYAKTVDPAYAWSQISEEYLVFNKHPKIFCINYYGKKFFFAVDHDHCNRFGTKITLKNITDVYKYTWLKGWKEDGEIVHDNPPGYRININDEEENVLAYSVLRRNGLAGKAVLFSLVEFFFSKEKIPPKKEIFSLETVFKDRGAPGMKIRFESGL